MAKPPTLAEIIAGAQSGNPESFDALIDAYSDRMYGYFYRLTSSVADAEDLLQELFVRLVRFIQHYSHQDRFDSFLFRIATNLYRDRLRRLRRQGRQVRMDEDGVPGIPAVSAQHLIDHHAEQPEDRLALHEAADRLQTALAGLPAAEREVILLRHFSDMSFRDIASAMGTPLGTALARAHRGLCKLRAMFENDDHG